MSSKSQRDPRRFVLNTRVDNMGSRVCIDDLHTRLCTAGFDAHRNDWTHYDQYDVAVFMGVDPDIERARAANPDIFIVIGDPKQSKPAYVDTARGADLLLVSSIEQREAFWHLNGNILIYPMFPMMERVARQHADSQVLTLAYHGNRVHLEAMGQHVTPALEALGRRIPCRLRLLYNIEMTGRAQAGIPDPSTMPTEHVQWSWEAYSEVLSSADIGIAPNLLPIHRHHALLRKAEVPGLDLSYEPIDYFLRFKASTNPGRIAVFGQFEIPVVTDFTPSTCQMIEDGVDGFLAGSTRGWFEACNQLAASPALRQSMGQALGHRVDAMQDRAFEQFVAVSRLPSGPPPEPIVELDDTQRQLARFAAQDRRRSRRRNLGRLSRAARRWWPNW